MTMQRPSSNNQRSHAEDLVENAEQPVSQQVQNGPESLDIASQKVKPSIWTDLIPRTDHNILFLDCDYGLTSLGPTSEWGPALRAYTTMAFAQNRGACVYWGPDRVAIYNEQFAVSCGGAHPFLMGHGFAEAFPELAPHINPVFELATSTGTAVDLEDIQLFTRRNGYLEETYFLGQFIPIRGDSGEIEGFYNTIIETTEAVLAKRHRKVVDGLASIPPGTVEQTLAAFMETLGSDPYDYTAVLLYSYNELAPEGTDNVHLVGKLSVSDGHKCALEKARLETCQDGLVPYFREAEKTGQPTVVSARAGDPPLSKNILDGIEWCGYGESPQQIVICSVELSGQLLGFYVQGTNPRRAYDETAKNHIAEAVTQLKVKWATAISRDEARARLRALEYRAVDSENRLRHMAQNAPLGMCQLGVDMRIQWANDQFWDLTGHDRSKPDLTDLLDVVDAEQRQRERFTLVNQMHSASREVREVRLARKWTPPGAGSEGGDSEPANVWILSVTFPFMEDGRVKMLLVFISDISQQKWAEGVQARNAAMAVQAERRQEAFLDITSHELRNPLSAMTQLADDIAKSLDQGSEFDSGRWHEVVENNVAAGTTILACLAHQQRVVDDILLLSRLDSQLITITPTDVQLTRVVTDTINMLSAVAISDGTNISAIRGDSLGELREVQSISTDMSRLMQLLVNLLGNAIKFTATQETREIEVLYGVQAQRPTSLYTRFGDVAWFPSMATAKTDADVRNSEGSVYAYFLVQDTGPGLKPDEVNLLFKRFSQATAKTQITYGGSGLGLYIVRTIVERQGGCVGVASEYGRGSAFAFYLPTKAVDVASARPEPYSTGLPAASHQTVPPDNVATLRLDGFNILLVEDNYINQKILAKQLRKAGCNVTTANNGKDALDVLERSDRWRKNSIESAQPRMSLVAIEVILMDIEMPIMNGLDCTKSIRRLQSEGQITRPLPIIATTANARQGQQDILLASGVDMVLTKPFTTGVLLTKIGEAVRQYLEF